MISQYQQDSVTSSLHSNQGLLPTEPFPAAQSTCCPAPEGFQMAGPRPEQQQGHYLETRAALWPRNLLPFPSHQA